MKGKLVSFIGAIVALTSPAHGSSSDWGFIKNVYGTHNGAVLFDVDAPRTALPGCQYPGVPKRWALDASTVAGQAQVAVLLSAQARGKRVIVVGMYGCSIWGDTETVAFFMVED